MDVKKNILFLKGKESAFVNTLMLIATIIFIVPIILVFSLRFLYKLVQQTKQKIVESNPVDANFNKVY